MGFEVPDEFLAAAHGDVHVVLEVAGVGVVHAGEYAKVAFEVAGVGEEADEVVPVDVDDAVGFPSFASFPYGVVALAAWGAER